MEAGIGDFNRQLPLPDMVRFYGQSLHVPVLATSFFSEDDACARPQVCDVATLMHEKGLARHYYPAVRLKVCDEVHHVLMTSGNINPQILGGVRAHVTKEYAAQRHTIAHHSKDSFRLSDPFL